MMKSPTDLSALPASVLHGVGVEAQTLEEAVPETDVER